MAVHVVTDSTADLPPEIARDLGITVVPLKVMWGDESFRDGIDITTDAFFERLKSTKGLPTTSQPSVGEFEEVYRDLAADGQPIISLHISSKLSGTYNSASTARSVVGDAATIEVVDTRLVSMGLGLVAIRVAKAARAGASLQECVRLAEETSRHTHIMFFVDTLEFLQRGGRIGKAQALVGTLLSIKPVMNITDGEVEPVERVRTRARAVEKLYDFAVETSNATELCVFGTPPLDDINTLARRVSEHFPNATLYRGTLGPVVGTHAGPGLVGMVVYDGPAFS